MTISIEDAVEQYIELCRNGKSPDIDIFAKKYPAYSAEL